MAQQKITFNEVSTNTTIVTSQLDSASANGTGAILVPSGTTAQRPAATTSGYIRFNTTLGSLESANGSAWANVGSGSASSGTGGVSWQPVQNSSFIAISGNGYAVNTQIANVTVTLPATPTVGNFVTLVDYKGTFGSKNLILYPNGNKINGNTSNTTLTTNGLGVSLVYIDSSQGWINYASPVVIGPYFIDYLIVAGGGGGGHDVGGGGGAGGVVGTFNASITPGTSYTVTVGGGGAGSSVGSSVASAAPSGTNSSFYNTTAIGGGGGGNYPSGAGAAGGSGGGGGTTIGTGQPGGAGTSGQGNPGGAGTGSGSDGGYGVGGGGGGAGGTGGNGGSGGSGTSNYSTWASATSTGVSGYYAGGGATAGDNGGNAGTPGVGGGGATLQAGTPNTGGGGGGSGSGVGAAGGSGIVIIRYQSPYQKASGGTITASGGYYYHTFTGSGTFVA